MRRRFFLSLTLVTATLLVGFSGCSGKKKTAYDESREVTILYPNWAEGIAFTYLAKTALEAKNFEVELINLEPGLIYGELSKSNAKGDVFMDAWLPNTHKDYWDDYGKDLVKLGESFSQGTTGLVVPQYVSIESIEQLNAHQDKFEGKIIGIGSGAGIHAKTLETISAYGLNFEQITSSGPAMVASLEKAIKKNEWIVVTGWKPHFKWANHALKYLKDPKGIYTKDVCTIIARKGFVEEKPQAALFFKNFELQEAQLYDLMRTMNIEGEEKGAKTFYENNKEMIDQWFNAQ